MRLWIQWALVTIFFCAFDAVLAFDYWWLAGLLVPVYFGVWYVRLSARGLHTFAAIVLAFGICFLFFLFQPELNLIAIHPTQEDFKREVQQYPGLLICGRPWPDWWEFKLNIIPWYTRFVPSVLYLWGAIVLVTALRTCHRAQQKRENRERQ